MRLDLVELAILTITQCAATEDVPWSRRLENSPARPHTTPHEAAIWPKRNEPCLSRCKQIFIATLFSSQMLETTRMSDRWIGEQNITLMRKNSCGYRKGWRAYRCWGLGRPWEPPSEWQEPCAEDWSPEEVSVESWLFRVGIGVMGFLYNVTVF